MKHADRLVLLLPLLISACTARTDPAHPAHCHLGFVGDMPILNAMGSPRVATRVNGHAAQFLVDTGAALNSIDPRFAASLSLATFHDEGSEHNPLPLMSSSGVDGEASSIAVEASTLALGQNVAHDVVFLQGIHLKKQEDGVPLVGLLGVSFLAEYDLLLDFPDHWVGLLNVHNCPAPRPLWHGPYQSVPFQRGMPWRGAIGLTFSLDATTIHGMLDSGASDSLISVDDALAAGVTRAELGHDPHSIITGIAGKGVHVWRHRFGRLTLGPITLDHPTINVVDQSEIALIGMDFLQSRRVWIPKDGAAMYIERGIDVPADDPVKP